MKEPMIFVGKARHRRYLPKRHSFEYPVYYFYADPERIEALFEDNWYFSAEKFNLISFYRKNYIGDPQKSIKQSVLQLLQPSQQNAEVFMLTQFSHLGYCFNPITLYFCLHNGHLTALIADVHNTPWSERHAYALDQPLKSKPPYFQFEAQKKLHVSPFMQMDFNYVFHLKFDEKHLVLHIKNIKQNKVFFDATLTLRGMPLTKENIRKNMIRYPLMSEQIILKIYWQALKLFLKGIPFVRHPS